MRVLFRIVVLPERSKQLMLESELFVMHKCEGKMLREPVIRFLEVLLLTREVTICQDQRSMIEELNFRIKEHRTIESVGKITLPCSRVEMLL